MINKVKTVLVSVAALALTLSLVPSIMRLFPESGIKTEKNMPAYKVDQDFSQKTYQGLVQILDENGEFKCSGVVISDDYVLTAAHCIDDGDVSVAEVELKFVQEAQAMVYNKRADYGLIQGNFGEFTKMPILYNPREDFGALGLYPNSVMACGFPWGAEPTCYKLYEKTMQRYYEKYSFIGIIYPGMSGGPVIDTQRKLVIAVNSAVTATGPVIIAPLIGIFENLKIKVE